MVKRRINCVCEGMHSSLSLYDYIACHSLYMVKPTLLTILLAWCVEKKEKKGGWGWKSSVDLFFKLLAYALIKTVG